MLLFYCAGEQELQTLRRRGLDEAMLWTSLPAAESACQDRIVVVDGLAVDLPADFGGERVPVPGVPPAALHNVDPYEAPEPVAAAGGYVVRKKHAQPEVLMIFRRGVWDVPKGKQDPGEDVRACAVREVQEEVGVENVHVVGPLPDTVHGYSRGGTYRVKTTHWFLMTADDEEELSPQKEEGIERVEWVPWSEARRRIGYETLRRHMEQIEPYVLEQIDALPDGRT